MPQSVWLTEVGKTRLEEELLDLRNRRRPEPHERIQEATESGDVSDNAEYEELKDEWAMLEARISELEQTLDRAAIIEKTSEDGVIGLGVAALGPVYNSSPDLICWDFPLGWLLENRYDSPQFCL